MAKIRKDGDRWMVDHYVQFGRDKGKRKRPYFKNKEEALEFFNECEKYEKMAELGLTPSFEQDEEASKELHEAIHHYLKTCTVSKNPIVQKNEKKYFAEIYEFLHGEKELVFLYEITLQHLEEYRSRLGRRVSPSTVNRHFRTIKNFFNKCVDWGWMEKSPATKLGLLPEMPVERTVWTDDQVDLVLTVLPTWAVNIVTFISETGVRPIEAASLSWKDVLYAQRAARVECGKGAESARYIPLTEPSLDFLSKLYAEARKKGMARGADPVFLNEYGERFKPDNLQHAFAKVRKKLKLPKALQIYGLRHTFATKLVMSGANIIAVKKLMGHSQIKTTERYTHLDLNHLSEVARIIQRPRKVAQ